MQMLSKRFIGINCYEIYGISLEKCGRNNDVALAVGNVVNTLD